MTKTQSCLEGPYVLQTCGTESKPSNALLVLIFFTHIYVCMYLYIYVFLFYTRKAEL